MLNRLIFLFLIVSVSSFGQTFQKITYGVDDGLQTHLTKAVCVDSLGFLWLGTDEGLIRYDGKKFTTYKDATQSRFVKKIVSINNELWVLNDLGLIKIKSLADTVIFEKIIDGLRSESDSLLLYPKDIYHDTKGRTWISEPDKISLIFEDNSIKKYHFPEYSHSNSFFRSYTLFEFNNELYVVSFHGQFFQYINDEFVELKNLNSPQTDHVNVIKNINGKVYLGDRSGFHEITISESGISTKKNLQIISQEVSTIDSYDNETLIIGIYGSEFYLFDINKKSILTQEQLFRVNDIIVTKDKDIWVASDEGVILFKRNYFNRLNDQSSYIESILTTDGVVYYCYKGGIYKVIYSDEGFIEKELILNDDEYFLSITGNKNDLWVSNRSSIIHFENDKLVDKINLNERGFYIFDVLLDKNNRLWINQDNTGGPLMIDSSNIHYDYRDSNVGARIMIMKESDNGKIYFGSTGLETYLLQFDEATKKIVNLSLQLPVTLKNDFEINDLVIKNDTIWLATTAGLFVQNNDKIWRLKLDDDILDLPVKAIQKVDNFLWFTNSLGVNRYNIVTYEIVTFNESSGLNSRSGNTKTLRIDEKGTKWVGTAKGLSYAKKDDKNPYKTIKPILTGTYYNDRHLNNSELESKIIRNGAYLKLNFISLTMPGNSIVYQYKTDKMNDWKNIGNQNYIELADVSSGQYHYLIRAKQQGNYSWSDPAQLEFEVDIPFYLKAWFISIVILISFVITYIVFKYNRKRLKSLELKLNKVVNEKTEQIQISNKELVQTNKELDMFVYSASHDMKAPLASLMGLLNIYDLEQSDERKKELIKLMRSSVEKLDAFLKEVIDYSKNSRLGINFEEVNFKSLIEELLDSFHYLDEFKNIKITIDDNVSSYQTDKNRIRIVLNNLISNSIRYSDGKKKQSWLKISIVKNDWVWITVEDNGIGIEAEYKEKIFDMFYRANETKTGSGLGLYIVKEAVRILEGEITVESEPHKGTKIVVKLPV